MSIAVTKRMTGFLIQFFSTILKEEGQRESIAVTDDGILKSIDK